VHFSVGGLEADDRATVTFSDMDGRTAHSVVNNDGEATVDLAGLADGTITAVLAVGDLAGNTFIKAASNTAVLDVDREDDLTATLSGLRNGNAIHDSAVVVSSVVNDGQDVGSAATYAWQESRDGGHTWRTVANGASFTPTEAHEFHALRVIVSIGEGNGAGDSITLSAGTVQEAVDEDEWHAGPWEVEQNWSLGIPTAHGHAVVEAAGLFTINADDAAASLAVNDTGALVEDLTGSLTLSGDLSVIAGAFKLGGDRLQAAGLDIHSQGVFEGFGTVRLGVVNDGKLETIANQQPALDITGSISGTGTIIIAGHSTLELGDAVPATQIVTFAGSTGTLVLDHAARFAGKVSGFSGDAAGSDLIDLKDIDFQSGQFTNSYANGVLTLSDGTNTAHISLIGNYTLANFKIAADGAGGTQVTHPPGWIGTPNAATFASGHGPSTVESDRAGEPASAPMDGFLAAHELQNAHYLDHLEGDQRWALTPVWADRDGKAMPAVSMTMGGRDDTKFVFHDSDPAECPVPNGSHWSTEQTIELDRFLTSSFEALHQLLRAADHEPDLFDGFVDCHGMTAAAVKELQHTMTGHTV
jgi:hypothetical protein